MSLRVCRAAACGAALLLSCTIAAIADPLPTPNVDYATKARMAGGATMHSRHSKGRLRVDMQAPGMPQAMTSYLDYRTRKGVTVMAMPGMAPMALEVDLGDGKEYGAAVGSGRRVGSATVAGEACEVWEVEPDRKQAQQGTTIACITPDSIPLRIEATVDGKRQVVFEVTELNRGPQDPKLMTPPANLKPMRLPKGMPGMPGGK